MRRVNGRGRAGHDHGDIEAHEFRSMMGREVAPRVRPQLLDGDVLTVDVTLFAYCASAASGGARIASGSRVTNQRRTASIRRRNLACG